MKIKFRDIKEETGGYDAKRFYENKYFGIKFACELALKPKGDQR